jgi:formiminotetrahydrofolate cyclodeaminase
MVRAAAVGAAMNVLINLRDLEGDAEAGELRSRAEAALRRTEELSAAVEAEVWKRLGRG